MECLQMSSKQHGRVVLKTFEDNSQEMLKISILDTSLRMT